MVSLIEQGCLSPCADAGSHREMRRGLWSLRWRDSAAGEAVRLTALNGSKEVLHGCHSTLLKITAVAPALSQSLNADRKI
jgi:hypothetical protein